MSSFLRCFGMATVCAATLSARNANAQVLVRPDTMAHVRGDTATLSAQLRLAQRGDEVRVFRRDSIARANASTRDLERLGERKPFYYGTAFGVSQPISAFHDGYTTGWNLTVPVGWDFVDSPFGVRVDGSWDKLTASTTSSRYLTDATIWSLNGDITLRRHFEPLGPGGVLYLLGGGGMHRIVASNGATIQTTEASANGFATSFRHADTRWGVNGGAGAKLTVGQLLVFVETRYIGVSSGNAAAGDARFFPMIIGIAF
jgi:hypothetical protein